MERQTEPQRNLKAAMIPQMSSSMQECIDSCMNCFQSCEKTITHCLTMGGKHAAPEHITLMQACAEICQTSAKFMMLQSGFHVETCRVCADVCKACAESCDRLEGAEMKSCAEACRKCAQSCEEMAKMH